MKIKPIRLRVVTVALILVAIIVSTASADSGRSESGNLGKHIAGTYLVREAAPNNDPSFLRLITLTADGNWLSTESHQQTVEFGFSDQQGVWKKSGPREITANVIDFDIDAITGEPNGVTRIRFVVNFGNDFQKVSAEFFGENFTFQQDPLNFKEIPVSTFEGKFWGKRVTVPMHKEKDD